MLLPNPENVMYFTLVTEKMDTANVKYKHTCIPEAKLESCNIHIIPM